MLSSIIVEVTDWQKAILDGGELYRVGGAVRDKLLGIGVESVEDIDFLIRLLRPEDLETRLRGYGRLELVGKHFGVYKFKPNDDARTFDLAYPRRERSTGTGHRDFHVKWDPELPVEQDLERRDFTMNAIAESVSGGELIDPCGGQRDIQDRVLRMIFPRAFEEDPLRILRGIRFSARFGLTIETSTVDAMKASAPLLSTLSIERVNEEFTRVMLQCAKPSEAFHKMHEYGVLNVLFPELERTWGVEQNEFHPDDVFWHSVKSCDVAPADDLLVRWSALLHDLGKVDKKQTVREDDGSERVVFYGHEKVSAEIAQAVLLRLRYPNDFVAACRHLVANHMFHYEPEWTDATVRRFMHRVGEENLASLFKLREADCGSRDLSEEIDKLNELRARVAAEIEAEQALKVDDLAVSGRDVMHALDVAPGQLVGEVLQALLEVVLDDPSQNRRDILLRYVKDKFG